MSKIHSITCASFLAAAMFTSAAYAGDSMTCTDATNGQEYSARVDGGKIKLKGPTWSINLTIIGTSLGNTYLTKVGKNGIHTNVDFKNGRLVYYRGDSAFRRDRCDNPKHVREFHNLPSQSEPVVPRYTVLDGIKAKCAGEWPGDYRMQKYCIDTQVEAFNALRNY